MPLLMPIQCRGGTAAAWTSANPTLLLYEVGIESDTRRFKIGDGSTAWASLPYAQTPFHDVGKVLRSPLPASTTQIAGSGRSYWCYVGYRPAGEIIQYVRFGVSVVGAGAQTAEVAVATSATPPTGSAISLTKLWADGTLDDLTVGTGIKGNASANTTPLSVDAHTWVGCRFAMATTQPTLHILQRDWGAGFLSQEAGAAALTGAGPYTATPVTFAANSSNDIRGYLA